MSINQLSSRVRTGLTVSVLSLGFLFGMTSVASAAPVITPDTLPNGRVGVLYSQVVSLNGPLTPAPTWSMTGGMLPPGVEFSRLISRNGGLVRGLPTTEGTYTFTVKANNEADYERTKNYTITILPMQVVARTLGNARVGSAYSETLSVEGGTGPYSWIVNGGQLPVGITLSSSGVLSGTPLYPLTHLFTVKVTDSTGRSAEQTFYMNVDGSNLDIATTDALPPGLAGTAYVMDFTATGGSPAYVWSLDGGSYLPPGLSLSASGAMRGAPTTPGNYLFTLRVRDNAGTVKTKAFSMTVSDAGTPVLAITTASLPNGTVGMWYGQNLAATGGVAPYTWNFASGTLPPGVTFSTNGSLYGTPTAAGTYSFHLEALDARRAFVGRTYTVTISPSTVGTPTGGSSEVTVRLNNFSRIGVSVHALVKLPDDGNRNTQADSAVYYLGADGRRHAFPNERVYFTWYTGFSGVRVVSASDMASIPLGANVTYKPGVKMVKFQSEARVYVVAAGRVLRPVASEAAAVELYGSSWNRQIDDISDAFYLDYNLTASDPVNGLSGFNPVTVRGAVNFVSEILPL